MDKTVQTLVVAGVLGAVIGIGQLLAGQDNLSARSAIGRAIVSSGLAVSSFSILAWIPNAHPALLVGAAAMVASLGTSGLAAFLQRFLGGR